MPTLLGQALRIRSDSVCVSVLGVLPKLLQSYYSNTLLLSKVVSMILTGPLLQHVTSWVAEWFP